MNLPLNLEHLLDRILGRFGYTRDAVWEQRLEDQHMYPVSYSEPQDVFVAGYPKSGNTWMQQLLTGTVYGMDMHHVPDRLSQETVPDLHAKRFYKRFRDECLFKTHRLPHPRYRRVIHLVRDGRDVMASYFAMNENLGKDITLREMIEEGKGVHPCEWHEHTRQWIENPHDADLIRVRYEDLHTQPLPELRRVCSFLQIERDDSLLNRVIDGCSFDRMQEKEEKYGWENEDWPDDKRFVRRGKIGGYVDEISNDLIEVFENKAQDSLRDLGYTNHNGIRR
jgi:hypothetical protein